MKEQNYLDTVVGVFGHPAAENPTVVIQEAAFAQLGLTHWRYLTIDVEPGALGDAVAGLKAFKMRGVNCTIPHKLGIIKYLDELSDSARLIGAVNTVINEGGRLIGDNTDGKGFMESLREHGVDAVGKKVVILGAGGAARAISVELCRAGARSITVLNRPDNKSRRSDLVPLLRTLCGDVGYVDWIGRYALPADTDILVNATPIGLYPNVDELPDIDLDTILPSMFVQDVIPNPAVTPLLKAAKERGAGWNTGMGMLVNQAALNTEAWTGLRPDRDVMLNALEASLGD